MIYNGAINKLLKARRVRKRDAAAQLAKLLDMSERQVTSLLTGQTQATKRDLIAIETIIDQIQPSPPIRRPRKKIT